MIALVATLALAAPFLAAHRDDEREHVALPRDEPELHLGGFVAELRPLDEPTAAAFGANGEVYVVESFRDRVVVLDAELRRVRTIGTRGGGDGELLDPHGIARHATTGELWIADTGNDRIVVFGADGTFHRSIGRRGSELGRFLAPQGIALDADRVYVADTRNHRVQVLDRAGNPERAFGSFGSANGELRFPVAVAVDSKRRIFVADRDDHRIERFDAQGRFEAAWGSFGPFAGQLASPSGLAIASRDGVERLYVADRDNHRVEVFDLAGALVHDWGVHALRPHEGGGRLHYPSAIAVDATRERALVVEGFENRVQLFGPITEAATVAAQSQERNTAAHFGGAIDAAGDLLVAVEPDAPGLLVLDTTLGEAVDVTRWAAYGTRLAQFVRPEGIELDPSARHAYVSDPGAARVVDYLVDRPAGTPLGYDPALARLSQALDLRKLARDAAFAIEPGALECRADGELFLADVANARVVELTPSLDVRRIVANEAMRAPVDLATDPRDGSLLVLDAATCRVLRFDRDGRFASAFGRHGDGDDELVRPGGIACAPDGTIFTSDEARHRVLAFDASGAFRSAFGKEGLGRAELYKPRGLAIDPKGRLVVMDHGNHRGQVLERDGTFVSAFGARLFTQPTLPPRPTPPKQD